jgi:hypothetical protein
MSKQRTSAEARPEPPPAEAAPKTQPVHVVRLRNIRAAIWANDTEYGVRYNVTAARLYKDNEEQWRTSDSFGRDDLLLLAKVLDLAHSWICEQVQGQEVPF